MTEQELRAWEEKIAQRETELMDYAKEIQQRERAVRERETADSDEARRYDLFFGATNDKHEAARPIASVILEPQPVRQEVSRADLMAMGAMILSLGALAASVAAMLL